MWNWHAHDEKHFKPKQPHFISNEAYAEIQVALADRVLTQLASLLAQSYLKDARLVQLFPEAPSTEWQLYVYRPYQTVTSARVKLIFDELSAILKKRYKDVH